MIKKHLKGKGSRELEELGEKRGQEFKDVESLGEKMKSCDGGRRVYRSGWRNKEKGWEKEKLEWKRIGRVKE